MMIAHGQLLRKSQEAALKASIRESSASEVAVMAARAVRKMVARRSPGEGKYSAPAKRDLEALLAQLHLVIGLTMDLEDATGLPDAPATALAIVAAYGRNTPVELDLAA